MNIDRNKILRMVIILALICILVNALTRVSKKQSQTLDDYARQNPDIAYQKSQEDETVSGSNAPQNPATYSSLPGASLNSTIPAEQRITYSEGFYYEPLSDNLQRFITGISYPKSSVSGTDSPNTVSSGDSSSPDIAYEDLRYVHIWHYDFGGKPVEGELICNQAIAQDLTEIFYELYRNEYHIAQVHLIDEYDGDYFASMEAGNSFCFNYNMPDGDSALSQHAYGFAVDINPLYNPYITYNEDNSQQISPSSAQPYADRSNSFPYKIDENDLCYQLFKEHGFIWGGSFNSCKDYQHFHKPQ